MKRNLLILTLVGALIVASLAGCGSKKTTEPKEVTVISEEQDNQAEEKSEEVAEKPEEEVEVVASESVTYEATNGQTVTFDFPAADDTILKKLENAGIAEPGRYTGTYIYFFNKDQAMICMNTTDPNALDFGTVEENGTITDEEYDAWAVDLLNEVQKYLDGELTAIDVDGDGEVTYADQAVCAVFTLGQDFYGTTDLY